MYKAMACPWLFYFCIADSSRISSISRVGQARRLHHASTYHQRETFSLASRLLKRRASKGARSQRGSNSVVECQLPKLNVAGSIPVSCSLGEGYFMLEVFLPLLATKLTNL